MSKPTSYQRATAILDQAVRAATVRVRTHRDPKITIERGDEEEIEVAIEGDILKGERGDRWSPEIPTTAEVTSAWRIDNGKDVELTRDEIKRGEEALLADYYADAEDAKEQRALARMGW